ncbi:MAG: hypothetical protein EOO28_16275 [Comamonadaceae bacterium]|nr:MAG: hypothetical protein EOO28_16275 [Comamonadaceae bacterium]
MRISNHHSLHRLSAALLLAATAAVPLAASAQVPAATAQNARLVTTAGGEPYLQIAVNQWRQGGRIFNETARDDKSIQLRQLSANPATPGEPRYIDLAQGRVFTGVGPEGQSEPITAVSAVSPWNLGYLRVRVNLGGELISHFEYSRKYASGQPAGWTVKSPGSKQKNNVFAAMAYQTAEFAVNGPVINPIIGSGKDAAPVQVNLATGQCVVPGGGPQSVNCSVESALPGSGLSIAQMTLSFTHPHGGPRMMARFVQTDRSGNWDAWLSEKNSTPYREVGRTADAIRLVPKGGTSEMRIQMDGKVEYGTPGKYREDVGSRLEIAMPEWTGQLGTPYAPVAAGISPGFQIQNKTDYPVLVTLEQIGCLYYEIVKPGQVFQRNTGAVWFTIKVSMAPDLREPSVESCIRKPAMYAATVLVAGITAAGTGGTATGLVVPAMLMTAAGQGAAIATQAFVTSQGGTTLDSGGARVGVASLSRGATMVGLMMLGGGAGGGLSNAAALLAGTGLAAGLTAGSLAAGELKVRLTDQKDIDAFGGQLTQEASLTGAYAGYPWPWKMSDRVMPRYDITGGPRIRTYANGATVILSQESGLTIKRVN